MRDGTVARISMGVKTFFSFLCEGLVAVIYKYTTFVLWCKVMENAFVACMGLICKVIGEVGEHC
jgi:hypothetical protein